MNPASPAPVFARHPPAEGKSGRKCSFFYKFQVQKAYRRNAFRYIFIESMNRDEWSSYAIVFSPHQFLRISFPAARPVVFRHFRGQGPFGPGRRGTSETESSEMGSPPRRRE